VHSHSAILTTFINGFATRAKCSRTFSSYLSLFRRYKTSEALPSHSRRQTQHQPGNINMTTFLARVQCYAHYFWQQFWPPLGSKLWRFSLTALLWLWFVHVWLLVIFASYFSYCSVKIDTYLQNRKISTTFSYPVVNLMISAFLIKYWRFWNPICGNIS
jgi:predicted NAD/FAD-binding protein